MIKSKGICAAAVAAFCVAAMGFGSLALASAEVDSDKTVHPIDTVSSNPCTGEDIDLQGEITVRWQSVDDGAGGYHFTLNARAKANGVGHDSGVSYTVNEMLREVENINPNNDQATITVQQRSQLIAQGEETNSDLVITIQSTVNANGEVTVDRVEFETECR